MKFNFSIYGSIVSNDRMGAFKMLNGLLVEAAGRTGQDLKFSINQGSENDGPDDGQRSPEPKLEQPSTVGDDFTVVTADGGSQPTSDTESEPAEPKRTRGRPKKAGTTPSGSVQDLGPPRGQGRRGDDADGASDSPGAVDPELSDSSDDVVDDDAQADGDLGSDQDQARVIGSSPLLAVGYGKDLIPETWDDPAPEPEPEVTLVDLQRAMTAMFTAMPKGATRDHAQAELMAIAGVSGPSQIKLDLYRTTLDQIKAVTVEYQDGKRKLPKFGK